MKRQRTERQLKRSPNEAVCIMLATNYNYYIRALHAHTAKIAVHLFSRGVEILLFDDSFFDDSF